MTKIVNGNDVLKVYDSANKAVSRAQKGLGPSFIECRTYRIRGHAGCESQDIAGYRPVDEIRILEEIVSCCRISEETSKKEFDHHK